MKITPVNKARLIVFLNTLTLIGGVITIVLLLRVIGSAAKQNSDTNAKIVASQKATEEELGCLASFFSQPNRQTLIIVDLSKCTIKHTDTGQTETLPFFQTQPSPAVPSSDTTQKSTTTPTSTQANNTPNQQIASQTPASSQTAPQETIAPAAKEILGIPLCVPFTGVCVR